MNQLQNSAAGVKQYTLFAFGLAAIYLFLNIPSLNNSHPYQGDESFYTVSAANMVSSGDYLTPSYFGEKRFNKPILNYWMVAGAYKLLGVSMWSGRIPVLIMACLTLMVTFRFGLLLFGDRRKALLGMAFLATSPLFISFSRSAMTEMALILFSVLAFHMFVFHMFVRVPIVGDKSPRHSFWGWVFSGLAFMIKGPKGLIPVLAMTVVTFFLKENDRKRIMRLLFHPFNIGVFLAITMPWYAYSYIKYPAMFLADMGTEGGAFRIWIGITNIIGNAGYYLISGLIYFIPFLPLGLYVMFSKKKAVKNPMLLLPLVYLAVYCAIFILFIQPHHSRYLLPIFPFIALILAEILSSFNWKRMMKASLVVIAVQALAYFMYPMVSNNALQKLVYQWKGNYSLLGSLGMDLVEKKEEGWCILYANNRNIDSKSKARFLLINSSKYPDYPGWRVISTQSQNNRLLIKDKRLRVARTEYRLIERPIIKANQSFRQKPLSNSEIVKDANYVYQAR